ncbi:MAG: LytTR family transcriptional regulator [Oscillospiraceae bacterium]|nr:LytTR family transcriptional regulator [Oscillospiraceae bacterium]
MRVECNISADCAEPYAILHIKQMSPAVAEAISILEKEGAASLSLVAVRDGKTYFIEPGSLELIRTEGRDVICYDRLKDRYKLDKPLYELERILGDVFIRVSKSSIVNIRQISHISAGFNGTLELVMKNGITDYISRGFRKSFKERLGLQ